MKIKTRLTMLTILSVALVAVIAGTLILSVRDLERDRRNSVMEQDIARGISQLRATTTEYLLSPSEELYRQWMAGAGNLELLVGRVRATGEEDAKNLAGLRQRLPQAKNVFLRLDASLRESRGKARRLAGRTEVSIPLARDLVENARSMNSSALKLIQSSHVRIDRRQRETIIIAVGLALVIVFFIAVAAATIVRSLLRPVDSLLHGIHVIGTGNLEHRFASDSRDEIGEISSAFGQMVERLRWITVSRDVLQAEIEDHKRTEAERVRLETQLLHSQKLEAVGRLAGGIAHDFNNLLTAIIGYSEMALRDAEDRGKLRNDVEEIRKAADRAASLTRQLLAFSRRQVLQPKVLDVNAVVRDVDKMLRRLIGEDVDLVTVLTEDIGRIKADPGQIEQVLMNLAVNAKDAMPKGGKLTIETANVELDEAYARAHTSVIPGPYVLVALSDTGHGMDAETQAKIFEPFFTTKEKGKGTGLGLSMVYGIVKQSGGNIWVYSEPGKGTTFKVYFPRVEDAVEVPRIAAPAVSRLQGSEVVLLAEDEEAVRELARDILERNGYTVLAASEGAEALGIAQAHEGEIHLLLTDVVMPGMRGRDLFERLAPLRPGLNVLYMSGYTDNAVVHQGILVPGTHFLQKPFTPDALLRKVREVLG